MKKQKSKEIPVHLLINMTWWLEGDFRIVIVVYYTLRSIVVVVEVVEVVHVVLVV